MRPTTVAAVLAVLAAASPTRADDAARLALAKKLMVQIREDDTIRASVPLMAAELREGLAQQGKKDDEAAAFADRFQARFAAEVGRYSDMMAEAYAQAFTEEELQAVIAFDDTPAGRKFIAQRPVLTQASFLTMQKLSREVAEEVAEDLQASRARAPGKL